MHFHNTIYIKGPSCRIFVEMDLKCTYCHVCGGAINILEIDDLKQKIPN